MWSIILGEYRNMVQRKGDIEAAIDTLHRGYISVKRINGKAYRYLQHRSAESDQRVPQARRCR